MPSLIRLDLGGVVRQKVHLESDLNFFDINFMEQTLTTLISG